MSNDVMPAGPQGTEAGAWFLTIVVLVVLVANIAFFSTHLVGPALRLLCNTSADLTTRLLD